MKELGGFFTKETVMEPLTFPGSLSAASGSGQEPGRGEAAPSLGPAACGSGAMFSRGGAGVLRAPHSCRSVAHRGLEPPTTAAQPAAERTCVRPLRPRPRRAGLTLSNQRGDDESVFPPLGRHMADGQELPLRG